MKEKILTFIITLLIVQTSIFAQSEFSNNSYSDYIGLSDFYPYQDESTNYWGVKCKEEIIVGAFYDSIKIWNGYDYHKYSYVDGVSKTWYEKRKLFAFKENNKWGIFSVNNVLLSPRYDDIEIVSAEYHSSYYIYSIYKENNKYGIMTVDGIKYCNAMFDSISNPHLIFTQKIRGYCVAPISFLVKMDNSYKIISENGIILLDKIENPSFFKIYSKPHYREYSLEKKLSKAIGKYLKKNASDEDLKKITYDRYKDKEYNSYYENDSYFKLDNNVPKRQVLIDGEKGFINDMGVIDITYNATDEDRLRRDPYNVLALKDKIDKNVPQINSDEYFGSSYGLYCENNYLRCDYFYKSYNELLSLIKSKGLNNSPLSNYITSEIATYDRALIKARKNLEIHRKAERSSEKIDRIAGIITGCLNTVSSIVTPNTTIPQITDYGDATSTSTDGNSLSQQYKNWEKRAKSNYNSLTNLGLRVKKGGKDVSGTNGQSINGGNYTIQKQKLREAQKEMKSIREKARKKGITINKSEYEDVTVSY